MLARLCPLGMRMAKGEKGAIRRGKSRNRWEQKKGDKEEGRERVEEGKT